MYKQVYIFAIKFETNWAMDKNNKKKTYNQYNPIIIKKLKQKYGLSTQFIGQSLRGDRTSDTSLKICEDYKIMLREINKVLTKL